MMEPADDSYYTIAAPAEAIYKDKGSKFLAYAWPVTDERQIRDALVVVVRYFGGTKLGVPGLIAAYKESAAAVLDAAEVVQRTVNTVLRIGFGYLAMNDVMRIVKEMQPEVLGQQFDNACTMTLSIRRSRSQQLLERLRNVESMSIDLK